MVYALASETSGETRAGSSPAQRTISIEISPKILPRQGKMKWGIFYETDSGRKACLCKA